MPTGKPLTEQDRCCVLKMHAQGRFTKSEISIACKLSRPVIIRIIDDWARESWLREHQHTELLELCSRDQQDC